MVKNEEVRQVCWVIKLTKTLLRSTLFKAGAKLGYLDVGAKIAGCWYISVTIFGLCRGGLGILT